MANAEDQDIPETINDERFLYWSKVGIIAFAIAFLVGVAVLSVVVYQDYRRVADMQDDGLSAFEGAELVAAQSALDVASSTCVSYDTGPLSSQAKFEVTDVELTGGTFRHRSQSVPGFNAKVQAYGVFGPTQTITVWTEDDGVHRDCGSPDL